MTDPDASIRDKDKVPLFSGKSANWKYWDRLFRARAYYKGYLGILTGDDKLPDDPKDLSLSSDQEKLITLNQQAFYDMIYAMDSRTSQEQVAFNHLDSARSTKYPEGNSCQAYEKLQAKYNPKAAPYIAALQAQFSTTELKRGGDPDVFITAMEDIRTCLTDMGMTISDKQLMIQILNGLTQDYENQQDNLSSRLNDQSNPLTVEQI